MATRAEVIAGLAWPALASMRMPTARRPADLHRIRADGVGHPTNEELVIARQMRSVLGATQARLAS